MTIQKLFCKIMLRSFVLILGLISVTELSANPEFVYSASSLESSVTAPQGGGNVKMTGRVLDETKAGVPGATVIVKGSTRGVITGNDGTFSIDVKPTDVIEISYLGYETQSIPVGTKTNIVTELVRKVSELEAVTVVAYGKQRKESIIGAINTIDAGELEVASGSLSSNLAGKLAGIVVMQRTGEPGSSAEFWIRGQSTFGAKTTPLVLVDGIERDMDFVDADDIATFSILKDATATALYGVRGANGIILITTKRGTEMTAPQIRVKAEFGITQPVQLPELANASQWIDYYNELYRDSGSTEMPISDYARQMYLSGRDPDLYPNVDWVNTIFKDLAMTGRVHASVTGGSPKIRYYVSASYYTEGGMFNVADNDRYDAQMNFNKYSSFAVYAVYHQERAMYEHERPVRLYDVRNPRGYADRIFQRHAGDPAGVGLGQPLQHAEQHRIQTLQHHGGAIPVVAYAGFLGHHYPRTESQCEIRMGRPECDPPGAGNVPGNLLRHRAR